MEGGILLEGGCLLLLDRVHPGDEVAGAVAGTLGLGMALGPDGGELYALHTGVILQREFLVISA